jgi:hypothetical protein
VRTSDGQSLWFNDWLKTMTGESAIPVDESGRGYLGRSPSQDADEARRKFGSQGQPTTNQNDSDAMIPPRLDMVAIAKLPKTGR